MELNMPAAAELAVMLCIYVLVLFPRWKKQGADMLAVKTLMYAHLALVLYVTLMPLLAAVPFRREMPYVPMNRRPFIDVTLRRGDYMRQIGLNTLLLMPYGFLRPLTKKGYRFLGTVILTFFFSLTIELLQPFTARTSDVTDLITNTAGGAAGCILSAWLRPLTGAILQKMNKERGFK